MKASDAMTTVNSCSGSVAGNGRASAAARDVYRPLVDVWETESEVVVTAEVPGVTRENLDVVVEGRTLRLRGRVERSVPADARPLASEYGVGDFERTFRLGEDVNTAEIGAELQGGVLTLRLPKVEAARPRRIAIGG